MLKKKIVMLFILSITVIFCSSTVVTNAEINEKNTKIGVGFKGEKEVINVVKPTVYEPGIKPTTTSLLPQTNEMIQSLIVMLIGITFLLVFLGMLIIKKTYVNKKIVI